VSAGVDGSVVAWVREVTSASRVTVVRGLREGGSPWLLSVDGDEVVLRVGRSGDAAPFATEVAALRLAAEAGVPAPSVLGHDDGARHGVPLLLAERLSGSSRIPKECDADRLRALGAAAARLHALPLRPSPALPTRDRPIGLVDFAMLRRERGASALLRRAEGLLSQTAPTATTTVFVHGDLWQGNAIWSAGRLSGLVDWDCAGAGPPGVDLGSLRLDAALCFGQAAEQEVLGAWEQTAGRAADDVAYWDAVAGLATPPDLGWFPDAMADQGRPDLDQATLVERRDAFLSAALDRL
jgi:aminoglycoside phosphotransferase (APT) family kinase protein